MQTEIFVTQNNSGIYMRFWIEHTCKEKDSIGTKLQIIDDIIDHMIIEKQQLIDEINKTK